MKLVERHDMQFFSTEQTTISKISAVYKYRNIYAHQAIIATDEALERFKSKETITFLRYDDKKEISELGFSEFGNYANLADYCCTKIREFLEKKKYLPL